MPASFDFPLSPATFDGTSRKVEAGVAFDWLRQGGAFLIERPWLWMSGASLALSLLVISLVLPFPMNALPFLPLTILLAGMLNVCHALAENRQAGFGDLLAGFRYKTGGLTLIGLMTALLLMICVGSAKLLAVGTTGWTALLLIGVISLILSVPVLLAFAFAPALHFFNGLSPFQAMRASFNACLHNTPALAVICPFLLFLLLLSLLSVGLGLLLLIPAMSGALYAAYRDIFPGT